jgi:hypothetical protein
MEEEGDFKEKRANKRFPISIPLTCCDSFGNMGYTETRDISSGGIGIMSNADLPVGSPLEIFLQMPDNGQKIYRKATVIWSANIASGMFRVGVQLRDSILNPVALILRAVNYQQRH